MESNPFDTSNTPDNAVKMWDYYCPTCYTKYMVCGICKFKKTCFCEHDCEEQEIKQAFPDENEKVEN